MDPLAQDRPQDQAEMPNKHSKNPANDPLFVGGRVGDGSLASRLSLLFREKVLVDTILYVERGPFSDPVKSGPKRSDAYRNSRDHGRKVTF